MTSKNTDSSINPPDGERPVRLTDEWLEFFSLQTERAALKAARRAVQDYRREALGAFIVLLVGLGFALYTQSHDSATARKATVTSGRAVSVDGCNRDFKATDTLRGIIVRLQVANEQSYRIALKRTVDSEALRLLKANRAAAQIFYTTTLDELKYPNCVVARKVVTDDPSKTIVVPAPLTKADAKNADVAVAAKRIAKGG